MSLYEVGDIVQVEAGLRGSPRPPFLTDIVYVHMVVAEVIDPVERQRVHRYRLLPAQGAGEVVVTEGRVKGLVSLHD